MIERKNKVLTGMLPPGELAYNKNRECAEAEYGCDSKDFIDFDGGWQCQKCGCIMYDNDCSSSDPIDTGKHDDCRD